MTGRALRLACWIRRVWLSIGQFMTVICLALSGVGVAHGALPQADDPSWIMANPAYKTPGGLHCCGKEHCRRAKAGEVVRIADGWRHVPTGTDLKDGQQGVYDSKDAGMWVCVWDGKEQCVFPGIGDVSILTENGIPERRKINWTVSIALIGWGGFGLVAWGATTATVNAHDKRLERMEAIALTEKDLSALNLRLGRIEIQLDRLLQLRSIVKGLDP